MRHAGRLSLGCLAQSGRLRHRWLARRRRLRPVETSAPVDLLDCRFDRERVPNAHRLRHRIRELHARLAQVAARAISLGHEVQAFGVSEAAQGAAYAQFGGCRRRVALVESTYTMAS